MLEHLMELPFKETPHRVITKGFLNLQNRTDLLTVKEVHTRSMDGNFF